jgi:hypothetical protein
MNPYTLKIGAILLGIVSVILIITAALIPSIEKKH